MRLYLDDDIAALSRKDIVRAVRNLEAAGISFTDGYYVLNQWQ